jgi:threonine dehydrogenase-like Zn-dependent dehydrogenase
LKGASKVYAIDAVPTRLAMAAKMGAEVVTVDFKNQDVVKTIQEAVPQGLDGMLTLLSYSSHMWCENNAYSIACIDSTTFHEPKTMLHKVEKALMLETDVSETPNEVCPVPSELIQAGMNIALTNR